MHRFRQNERTALEEAGCGKPSILIVEDSRAVATMLEEGLKVHMACDIHRCHSKQEAEDCLAAGHTFDLAIAGLNLPDAPRGEVLDLLHDESVPTLLYTATFDRHLREEYASRPLIDYIVKDAPSSVEHVIRAAQRFIENKGVTVLVVDDTRSARSTLVEILRRQNYRVIEAVSGETALTALNENPNVQLVVTDYNMPDMDGYELTKRILARPNAEHLRIVGVSSSTDRFLSVSFLKAGASDFVYRPFLAEELQCRIEHNVETLKSMGRLKHLAERDALTGLYNRRVFFERLTSKVLAGPKFVGILDIDHFKSVNDNFGHDSGDAVIKAIAGQIDAFGERHNFTVARLGGEEFGFLAFSESAAGIDADFEELRAAIAGMDIPIRTRTIKVTASIGISRVYPDEPPENFMNAADQLLYMAKNSGRNKVCSDAQFD